ncbi:MAG TPA: aspartate carbamoyltransferase catalytic subunit [Bacillota bacterium]
MLTTISSSTDPVTQRPVGSARTGKDLLGIAELDRASILALLDAAARWKRWLLRKPSEPTSLAPAPLAGRRILTLFYENSTRTMQSFHVAARSLGAEVADLPVSRSSVAKGESLLDTLHTVRALGYDCVIIRHPATGAARFAAQHVDCPVVNAGDGTGEHPTQALLDALTVLEHKGHIEGLRITIIGDIRHSRVARSDVHLFCKLGAEVRLAGPATLLPHRDSFPGVKVFDRREQALEQSDVVIALRVQRERQDGVFLAGAGEYRRFWGLDLATLERLCPDALIMHPGPVNRGVELESEVLASPRCVVGEQVQNGVAARMAVLAHLLAAEEGPRCSGF